MKQASLYLILIFIAISMLLPFLAMFLISLTGDLSIFQSGSINFSFQSYKSVFNSIPIIKYFLNSLLVATVTTAFQVFVSALAGYGFARYNFRFKEVLFYMFILTMMIPPQVNIVPLFYLMSKLGWINTYKALIVPGIFGGFGVYMLRQHFGALSKELEDASRLDGCTELQTFFKIALPCALPALVTLGIFTFVTTWNSFMWPLLVTNTESMRTLAVGLTIFKSSFREVTLWGELMACSTICALPVIVLFVMGKKYLINNPTEGGIKE